MTTLLSPLKMLCKQPLMTVILILAYSGFSSETTDGTADLKNSLLGDSKLLDHLPSDLDRIVSYKVKVELHILLLTVDRQRNNQFQYIICIWTHCRRLFFYHCRSNEILCQIRNRRLRQ
jgi:hypothetical protein